MTAAARTAIFAKSRKKYPEKANARSTVQRAVRAGRLVRPDNCARCGIGCQPEASHDDYSKPLDVEWLCRACHARKDAPTHCRNGHELTPGNVMVEHQKDRREPSRRCRRCRADARSRRRGTK